jgi:glucose/arabinose dehydrogenase
MRGRAVVALIAATVVSTAVMSGVASGAKTPPPPKATNGASVQLVAADLKTPTAFAFGDGAVFEADGGSSSSSGPPNGGVFLLKGGKATKIAGSPEFVAGLAWHDGSLYVSGGSVTGKTTQKWQLFAWSGWNGTKFTEQKAIYTAPAKLNGLNGLAFGPDGRLYFGIDVGLTDGNDHGAVTTSPLLYEILSISPTGKDLKVFATGIRQPWQFVFRAGSPFPLVSDLGQDSGVKDPLDAVLQVHPGDDYGFPKCNWSQAAPTCAGFAKPFQEFPPHTDIMGLAIIGSKLYMTSFDGPGGKGPGGEVLSMPVSGGKTSPVVTGFVAPIVALGENDGWLYVGETTGQVFRTKP